MRSEQSRLSHTLQGPQAEAYSINLRNVSSSFGQSVLDTAYLAVLFSLIIIFIYVWFRFEWVYAVPVMVALAHDILITIGIYSLSGRSVTADTIAAVLTVLGYSMYDTVIVFDRVRENIPILRRMSASQIVNQSLAETITRSLNTSFVTLIPVVLLFIFWCGRAQGLCLCPDRGYRLGRLLVDLRGRARVGDADGATAGVCTPPPGDRKVGTCRPATPVAATVPAGPNPAPAAAAPAVTPPSALVDHSSAPPCSRPQPVTSGLPSGKTSSRPAAAPIQTRHATGPRFHRSPLLESDCGD